MGFVYSSPSNFELIDRVAAAILQLLLLCSFSSMFLYIFISCFIKKSLLQYLAKEMCFLCSFSSNFQHSFISVYIKIWHDFSGNIQPVNFVVLVLQLFFAFFYRSLNVSFNIQKKICDLFVSLQQFYLFVNRFAN